MNNDFPTLPNLMRKARVLVADPSDISRTEYFEKRSGFLAEALLFICGEPVYIITGLSLTTSVFFTFISIAIRFWQSCWQGNTSTAGPSKGMQALFDLFQGGSPADTLILFVFLGAFLAAILLLIQRNVSAFKARKGFSDEPAAPVNSHYMVLLVIATFLGAVAAPLFTGLSAIFLSSQQAFDGEELVLAASAAVLLSLNAVLGLFHLYCLTEKDFKLIPWLRKLKSTAKVSLAVLAAMPLAAVVTLIVGLICGWLSLNNSIMLCLYVGFPLVLFQFLWFGLFGAHCFSAWLEHCQKKYKRSSNSPAKGDDQQTHPFRFWLQKNIAILSIAFLVEAPFVLAAITLSVTLLSAALDIFYLFMTFWADLVLSSYFS